MQRLVLFGSLLLVGCAASTPVLTHAPIPDEVGWVHPMPVEVPPSLSTPPLDPPASRSEKVYTYEPGQDYEVPVMVGSVLDVTLQPGEVIDEEILGDRSILPSGDDGQPKDEEPPFKLKRGKSGQPPRPHVFVTVTRPGLRTGLTVTTDRRVYTMTILSVPPGKGKIRVVRWTYADDVTREASKPVAYTLPNLSMPSRYYVGFQVETSTPAPLWAPQSNRIYHDAQRTYIVFPYAMTVTDAPVMRLLGPNGPELVNVRKVDQVYVIDHVLSHAELRLGSGHTAQVVRITREASMPIDCPSDPACPTWSARVAGR